MLEAVLTHILFHIPSALLGSPRVESIAPLLDLGAAVTVLRLSMLSFRIRYDFRAKRLHRLPSNIVGPRQEGKEVSRATSVSWFRAYKASIIERILIVLFSRHT